MRSAGVIIVALFLNGCVARLAADVVTAPIKIVSKTADVLTTSQEEADLKRGRAIRKAEEQAEKDRKREEKATRKAQRDAEDDYY
jgi:PBP1b-binding outer membrane lipoprotein LpoB